MLMTFGMFGSIFLLAQFFQTVQGYSPLDAGLRMALDAGMPSALVLTGETTPAMVEDIAPEDAPDWVLARVDQVLPPAEWERLGWRE